ncbi:MAG: hypothetical protein EXR31_03420 [Betaproteobacteria bacterium]|nr:hypothetical protein [Betaproteobacteria bacterium]
MHIELLVPSLLLGRAPPGRLPALELVLARARRRSEAATTLDRWLLDACGAPEGLPAGALTMLGEGGEPGDGWWLRADPVHLAQQGEMLTVMPPPAISVSREEARAFADTLNAHFGAAFELHPMHPERWCARAALEGKLEAVPPLEAAGRNADSVLPGGDTKRWHALLNEAQMLLHGHPANAAREARGERAVNSLWLWGPGGLPGGLHGPWQSMSAGQSLARGLARACGIGLDDLAHDADSWLARLPPEGRHLVVLDAMRIADAFDDAEGWAHAAAELEAQWMAPLLAALRTDRIHMLTLHVPDATEARGYELARGDLRRFWRRPRPLDAA